LEADFITLYNINDEICIHIFFMRHGQSFGFKSYFLQKDHLTKEEILEQFLLQFYNTHIPPQEIITNLQLSNNNIICTALKQLHNISIKLTYPKIGKKSDIIKLMTENAKHSLTKHMAHNKKHAIAFENIAQLFNLPSVPERIEIYDNSHISGQNAVGAMVVATKTGLAKNQYRIFNIKLKQPISGGDDYAMLQEVLKRRLSKLNAQNRPDLMLIDGGKGHLSSALEVLEAMNLTDIPIVCISKGPNRNAGREYFHISGRAPFQLAKDNDTLRYLQYIRDEAHNFAITSHRNRRSKSISKSALDGIPNVGLKRKQELLKHFGSVKAIQHASIKELSEVSGFNTRLAEIIYKYLHNI